MSTRSRTNAFAEWAALRTPAVGTTMGLDIGAHSAKLVVRRFRGSCGRVIRASRLRIPSSARSDAGELVKVLGPWLEAHGEPGCRRYVAALPSTWVDYETVELSPTTVDDVGQVAEAEIQRLLGNDAELAATDFWSSDAGGAAPPVLHLAWTNGEFVSQLASGLAREGWRCTAIDVPAVALARADGGATTAANRLMADIGGSEASLVWSRGGVADYVRHGIRFAAASAADTLAAGAGVSVDAAETLLMHWGLGPSRGPSGGALEATIAAQLREWLPKLVFELRRTLRYLQHHYGLDAVAEVVLCGGGSCICGLSQWLTAQLKLPVRRAALPIDWRWEAATPHSACFAQAVALTQYGEPS